MWALDHIIVILSRAFVHTIELLDEAARTDLTRIRTHRNIWLAPYMQLVGVCLSSTGSMASSTKGPERGVIETIILSVLWLQVRKLEGGSFCESPSTT